MFLFIRKRLKSISNKMRIIQKCFLPSENAKINSKYDLRPSKFCSSIRKRKQNAKVSKAYLLFILSVFRWKKTLLKASDCICYSFWAFSDERKHFWSIRILFAIDFKRFRMNENNFEVFAFDLPSNLSFFEWSKTHLKPSHSICYWF